MGGIAGLSTLKLFSSCTDSPQLCKGAVAYALTLLGQVRLYQGEHTAAQAFLGESLDLQKELQDRWGGAQSLAMLAKVKAYQGDNAGAGALYQQSLDILGDVGDRQLIAACLEGLAATVL